VIPALIRKCVAAIDAKAPSWSAGAPGMVSREFLYVDDAAEGVVRAAEAMDVPTPVNLGTGMEITIKDLVTLIARLTGFDGEIRWNSSKPDGQPRRCLDTQRARQLLGWHAEVGFEEGLRRTIEWWRREGVRGASKA
jgi:GDP-L-fucose synthase